MLFLVIDEVKIEFVQPEVSLAQITMLKQTFELYEEMKNKGKLKFCYAFADFPGGVCIWDVESNEELRAYPFLASLYATCETHSTTTDRNEICI